MNKLKVNTVTSTIGIYNVNTVDSFVYDLNNLGRCIYREKSYWLSNRLVVETTLKPNLNNRQFISTQETTIYCLM